MKPDRYSHQLCKEDICLIPPRDKDISEKPKKGNYEAGPHYWINPWYLKQTFLRERTNLAQCFVSARTGRLICFRADPSHSKLIISYNYWN